MTTKVAASPFELGHRIRVRSTGSMRVWGLARRTGVVVGVRSHSGSGQTVRVAFRRAGRIGEVEIHSSHLAHRRINGHIVP
ncbi:hypothetical protein LCGC14_1911550 [marine sediment metagenome]|uniref:Uncharacterized protein n=1 Tax=marine sediment metagenome TaxID=412755 RepID=A0A0F9FTG4_9ZZZZ